MSTKEAKQMDQALFDFYGKPSIGQALPLAIQHVLAMIVGCVTPSIIVAGVAGLSQEDSVILIQAALVESVSHMFRVCRQSQQILTLQRFWEHRSLVV